MGSTECLSSSDHFSHPMCLVLLASSLFKPALQRQLRPSQHKEKAISSITFNQSTGARRVYFIPESVSPFPSSLLSSSSDIFTSPGPTLINVRQSSANMPRLFHSLFRLLRVRALQYTGLITCCGRVLNLIGRIIGSGKAGGHIDIWVFFSIRQGFE